MFVCVMCGVGGVVYVRYVCDWDVCMICICCVVCVVYVISVHGCGVCDWDVCMTYVWYVVWVVVCAVYVISVHGCRSVCVTYVWYVVCVLWCAVYVISVLGCVGSVHGDSLRALCSGCNEAGHFCGAGGKEFSGQCLISSREEWSTLYECPGSCPGRPPPGSPCLAGSASCAEA